MQRILSGIRPTGEPHIGNYLGALSQWVELAGEPNSEGFFMIADYHALISWRQAPLDTASLNLLAWLLVSGLDPAKVTIFVQSAIAAHTEFSWMLSGLATVAELTRMTQYKDLVRQGLEQPTAALLTYPLLQAADILLYQTDLVPVGEDQVQHIELTRTMAERVNRRAGREIVRLPKPRLTATARVMSLDEPTKKMAKSRPSGAILLLDEPDIIRHKIMRAVTDSEAVGSFPAQADTTLVEVNRARLFEAMTPGVRNLFMLLDATASPDTAATLLGRLAQKTLLYQELKEAVAEATIAFVSPLQARYHQIRPDEKKLRAILAEGTNRACAVAQKTLGEVKKLFRLIQL